jgi:hypothetical protein
MRLPHPHPCTTHLSAMPFRACASSAASAAGVAVPQGRGAPQATSDWAAQAMEETSRPKKLAELNDCERGGGADWG